MKIQNFYKLLIIFSASVLGLPVKTVGLEPEKQQVEIELMKKVAENIEKYRKGEVEIVFRNASGQPLGNAEVEIRQTGSDFLFGCIIFPLVRVNKHPAPQIFRQMFKEIFNFAVFPFYWAGYEPNQGMSEWQRLIPVIEWCKANDITTKGHPLVWTAPSGKPGWLTAYSNNEQIELLKARIMNIVGGYKGMIDIWDVFNEPVIDPSDPQIMYLSCWPWTDRSTEPRLERNGGLYRTADGGNTWEQVFFEGAHVYATAIDPERPSSIYINTFDSAAFCSHDRGETWNRLQGYTFKWGHRPILDPHHPGMIYLTTFGGSVFYGPAAGVPGAFEHIEDATFLRWASLP